MAESNGATLGPQGVPGRSWFDSYTLRAHWAPVLAVITPPLFAAYLTFPSLLNAKGASGGALLVAGLPPLLGQVARGLGKRLEPGLWASWGGPPTTRLLRHRDSTIAEPTKHRYFKTLAGADLVRPTAEKEAADPPAADQVYESAGAWLRQRTRQQPKGSLVAAKNASYGLARNLLGMRWIGALLTLTAGFGDLWLAFRASGPGALDTSNCIAAATVNLTMAAVWVFAVRPEWVRLEAEAYALAILECCEPASATKLRAPATTPRKPRQQRASKGGAPANQTAGE